LGRCPAWTDLLSATYRLWASFDDGRTWKQVALVANGIDRRLIRKTDT
jgi:hypothetical protein